MKWIWSLFILCIFTLPVLGQNKFQQQPPGQRLEAVKIAFITSKLDLTSGEAEKFWPVYNTYQKELTEIVRKKRENRFSKSNDPDEALSEELEYESDILDLRKKYTKEFSRVLPSEKVVRLYQAEREFRERLIKQLQNRKRD